MFVEKLFLPKWMIPHWWYVAYKILPQLDERFRQYLEIQPDEEFNRTVGGHVEALLQKGIQPPEEIAAPIYNLATQVLNGHEMMIGAGDYIALQTFMRTNRPK